MIKESKWIRQFENELNRKKIFCLYGNINDDFFYESSPTSMDEYFKNKFQEDNIKIFFDDAYYEDLMSTISEDPEAGDINNILYSNYFSIVEDIVAAQEEYIIVKDTKLCFPDYTCDSSKSHSLRYFLEYVYQTKLEELDKKKIIFVSEDREDFPKRLIVNNPYTSAIYVDYPEDDERKFYIKECLEFLKYRKGDRSNLSDEMLKEDFDTFVKITNKMKLKDIRNIVTKAREEGYISEENKSIKDIVNSYNFGDNESPWTNLNIRGIKKLEEKLKRRVKGQDEAIDFVKKVIYRAKLDFNGVMQPYSTKPKGVMFFTGPSGVGKTELAKSLTEAIFGDESAFKRFDMSEYKTEESINKLIGSNPGYVGYNEGGQLTNWIINNPYSIILFDEIDKANIRIWDTFLQILEDGRLTDSKGNTGYFNESIIIFTSNIGNSTVENKQGEEAKKHYLNELEKYFKEKVGRIEILNRFGENKIVFNHIGGDVLEKIVRNKLEFTAKNINKKMPSISLKFEDIDRTTKFFIKNASESQKFGARLVNSLIENKLINNLSVYIVENDIKRADIILYVEDGEIKFR